MNGPPLFIERTFPFVAITVRTPYAAPVSYSLLPHLFAEVNLSIKGLYTPSILSI